MNPTAAAAILLLSVATPAQGGVRWYSSDFSGALRLAAERGQGVLAYFWMDGSQHCHDFWSQTLSKPSEDARLGKFVCFSAKVTEPEGGSLAQRHAVTILPTVLVVAADGQVDDAIVGHVPTAEFDAQIDRILAGEKTVSALRRIASESPDDLALRYDLALKLAYVGDLRTSRMLLDSIRADDPGARTLGGAKIALRDALQDARQKAADPSDPKGFDLRPVRALLGRIRQEEVVFQGWDTVAGIELGRGDSKAARDAYARAAKVLPDDRIADWPASLSGTYWQMRADLTQADRRMLRELVENAYGATYAAARAGAPRPAEGDPASDPGTAAFQIAAVARALLLDGEKKAALEAIRTSIGLDPENEELAALLQSIEAAR